MEGAGDEFLAGAAFAGDEDGDAGGCDALDEGEDLEHGRGGADEAAEDAGFAKAAAGDFELDFGFALAGGVGKSGAQSGSVNGFLQEIVCTHHHGVDGEVDGAHGGEDDDNHIGAETGAVFSELGEEANAIHAGHFEVGNDDVGRPCEGFFPAFDTVAGGFSTVAPARDELSKAHESVGLVFDDEDLYRVLHKCSWLAGCMGVWRNRVKRGIRAGDRRRRSWQ